MKTFNLLLQDIFADAVCFSEITTLFVSALQLARRVCSFLTSFGQVVTACLLLYLSTPTRKNTYVVLNVIGFGRLFT